MGKTPEELDGLTDGQVDWMYYGIVDKYEKQAAAMKSSEDSIVFESQN